MKRRNYNLKAHREWRQKLIDRDKGCIICGKDAFIAAHHLIPYEFKEYQYESDNGVMLCPTHHSFGSFSAHKNPFWFYEWMLDNRAEILGIALRRLMELGNQI